MAFVFINRFKQFPSGHMYKCMYKIKVVPFYPVPAFHARINLEVQIKNPSELV